MYKGSLSLCIQIIGKVRTIWYEIFFKTRISFFGLVSKKKVFSESSHCIYTHSVVAVEVLELPISVPFKLCLDEELIEFW